MAEQKRHLAAAALIKEKRKSPQNITAALLDSYCFALQHITLRMRLRLAPYRHNPQPIFASGKHFVQLYHWQTSHTQESYVK